MPQPAFTDEQIRGRLRAAGMRPTRLRVSLGAILLDGRDRHVTAEQICAEAEAGGLEMSRASVYNTLAQLTGAGLLRVVEMRGRVCYDTNTLPHHHAYDLTTGAIYDLPAAVVQARVVDELLPQGTTVEAIDVWVTVRS